MLIFKALNELSVLLWFETTEKFNAWFKVLQFVINLANQRGNATSTTLQTAVKDTQKAIYRHVSSSHTRVADMTYNNTYISTETNTTTALPTAQKTLNIPYCDHNGYILPPGHYAPYNPHLVRQSEPNSVWWNNNGSSGCNTTAGTADDEDVAVMTFIVSSLVSVVMLVVYVVGIGAQWLGEWLVGVLWELN
jgi:hypothetical protein